MDLKKGIRAHPVGPLRPPHVTALVAPQQLFASEWRMHDYIERVQKKSGCARFSVGDTCSKAKSQPIAEVRAATGIESAPQRFGWHWLVQLAPNAVWVFESTEAGPEETVLRDDEDARYGC